MLFDVLGVFVFFPLDDGPVKEGKLLPDIALLEVLAELEPGTNGVGAFLDPNPREGKLLLLISGGRVIGTDEA